MRRGEIRLVDLEPVKGAEANKRRPAVIVSNDGANTTAARLNRGVITYSGPADGLSADELALRYLGADHEVPGESGAFVDQFGSSAAP